MHHQYITDNVYGVESELRHEQGLRKVIKYLKVRLCVDISAINAERLRSDRKFRIPTLEGAAGRSNESESVEPHHHVRGNGKLKHRDRGSVITTEGSDFGR